MLDFLRIATKKAKGEGYDPDTGKKEVLTIVYPKFVVTSTTDLMIRGHDFYAIWNDEERQWSTDEADATRIIDSELDKFVQSNNLDRQHTRVLYLWDGDTGMIDKWHKYCRNQMWDNFHILDQSLIFSNTEISKGNYSSKKLPYPLEEGSTEAFDTLFNVLYSETELNKLKWAIGSIVKGDSCYNQKFVVLYGDSGTGKSTILNVINDLFAGYCSTFDAKALGSTNNAFSLESFNSNPLVAIQHDGDLSRIEDNTTLNSLVSHEKLIVNEKHKSVYSADFKTFLFMGTNKPVRITDAKSGLLRRLIDVTPTGKLVSQKDYKRLIKQIEFEKGAIAYSCLNYYISHMNDYDDYVPYGMMSSTNSFYNFIVDNVYAFKDNYITLAAAWNLYKQYCTDANVPYPLSKMAFKEELKNYFDSFEECSYSNGERMYNVYKGFKKYKMVGDEVKSRVNVANDNWLTFDLVPSKFDILAADYLAQYTNDKGTPKNKWSNVTSRLKDLQTNMLHYVKVPENHIVIDFDIPDETGEKSFEKNYEAALKFPPTYAELSKSGKGIHLHYIYTGDDLAELDSIYDKNIEVKIFKGDSSLRRMLTRCNDLDIASLSSGLPHKKDKKKGGVLLNEDFVLNDKNLRTIVEKCLRKEYPPYSTKCSIDFIKAKVDEAVEQGIKFDISDLRGKIVYFAEHSKHNKEYCFKIATNLIYSNGMDNHTSSESEGEIAFYDIESVPNLLLVVYKERGKDKPFHILYNPTPEELETMMSYKLIGFNNREYDDPMIYARYMGYSVAECNKLSHEIIKNRRNPFGKSSRGVSYADIYDITTRKQSLKKFEIELGIDHVEWELDWDQPLPEELWPKFAQYCCADVAGTEAIFDTPIYDNVTGDVIYNFQEDWEAREILSKISGLNMINTTNECTTKFIFGDDKNPSQWFNYRDLSKPVRPSEEVFAHYPQETYRVFDQYGEPCYRDYIPGEELPEGYSILPFFPEYTRRDGKSYFNDEEVGEGGLVYAEPGMYEFAGLLDIASMHPHSALAENLFGAEYTKRFKELIQARIYVKHADLENARKVLNGALAPFLENPTEQSLKRLAYALKIAINSVYGLTAARFKNAFYDERNVDNIVAKRGALFMSKLKRQVQLRGYTVAHIKTDSIKIPNIDNDIIEFVCKYGKEYGYTFEHEDTYSKICLVNNAVYIAKSANDNLWHATGKQFAVPFVKKTLFDKTPITIDDVGEIFNVTTSLYLDCNEGLDQYPEKEKELDQLISVYKKGSISDEEFRNESANLLDYIDKSHRYHFIGRVGKFCPVKEGNDGGWLMRKATADVCGVNRYSYAANTKGYRWLEYNTVKDLGLEKQIDTEYFYEQVREAEKVISEYAALAGRSLEWFCAD